MVLGAVVCAAYGLTIVASAMSIYALGVGAWLYHAIRTPDLGTPHQHCSHGSKSHVAAAATGDGHHHGPDAGRGASLGDVTDLPARRRELSNCRCCAEWTTPNRANRRSRTATTADLTGPARVIYLGLHSTALPAPEGNR